MMTSGTPNMFAVFRADDFDLLVRAGVLDLAVVVILTVDRPGLRNELF